MFCGCVTAWVSAVAGCVGTLRCRNAVENTAAESVAGDSEVQQASYEEPDESSVRPAVQRSFPQQGWWCSEYDGWLAPERLEQGYTLIFPGVEGTSWFNISIARGLVDAGHEAAIEINDWTTGYWPMFVYHLMALERNREQARQIAARICDYQDRHPDRPVTLIGHSGGAGMAVLVLEALPAERKVTQAVLLAGALSPDYDLSQALSRTERGITNFYSFGDAIYLAAGTLALGTIDRQHAVSAGAIGFRVPEHLTTEERSRYEELLHQEPYQLEMLRSLNLGGHFGQANRRFVAEWVAPRLR